MKGSVPGKQGCPPLTVAFPDPLSLELGVGRRPTLQEPPVSGRGGEQQQQQQQQQSQGTPTLLEVALSWPGGISGNEKAAVVELAESALQEILHMVQAEEPLWIKKAVGDQPPASRLDAEAYTKRFPARIGKRIPGLVTEATRESGTVSINSLALLDALMDAVRAFVFALESYMLAPSNVLYLKHLCLRHDDYNGCNQVSCHVCIPE